MQKLVCEQNVIFEISPNAYWERSGKGMVKVQVVIRLAEVVACRRRKQAKREWAKNGELLQVWMGYS